jgi:hypothetical protein
MNMKNFKNQNLKFDFDKIKSYDEISIRFDKVSDNDYPYVLDINDNSYFYANDEDRAHDYQIIYAYISSIEQPLTISEEQLDDLESWIETFNPENMIGLDDEEDEDEDISSYEEAETIYNRILLAFENYKEGIATVEDEDILRYQLECIEEGE